MTSPPPPKPERTTIGGTLEIPRLINGLWQLADQNVDIPAASDAMDPLIEAGLDTFDMADHYGDAELVIGRHNGKTVNLNGRQCATTFTKWCPPEDGDMSFEHAEAAVDLALSRMQQHTLQLMQYHVWDYTDETYLLNVAHLQRLQQQGKIEHIGLTNVDAAHLELLIHSGYTIATNQVSCSVLDRRLVSGRLGEVCKDNGVGVLAYGTLLGGFLSEKWLSANEPRDSEALGWSLRKYLRFIHSAGGWNAFQTLLRALSVIANKHGVFIAAVATRWVLDLPIISAVIVGNRLSADSHKYTSKNLRVFSFSLDESDRALIAEAQAGLKDIPGDCGDEYRRPPFLTATGDLSHHIKTASKVDDVEDVISRGGRVEYRSGSKWESIAGYSRAVRVGNTIRVSGTTANPPPKLLSINSERRPLGGKCARCQAVASLDIIARSIKKLGGKMSHVVRTRVMIRNEDDCPAVSSVHGWTFHCEGVYPSNTLVVASMIGEKFLVEIEAEAVVGSSKPLLVLD